MTEELAHQEDIHTGPALDVVGDFTVIDCERCGFAHIVPIPTTDDLVDVYKDEYYTTEKPLYLEHHNEDADWWRQTYGERYDRFEELLPPDRRRILDIGSGPGFFLLTGKERGWEVQGIEPSVAAAEHARSLGVEVMGGFFGKETAKELGTFDVIHMSEVLEHIPDPHELISTAEEILNPGGLIYVMVPNDYSAFQQVLREARGFEPWWVAPPHHINYFNQASLSRLLDSHGLQVVDTEATFPIDMFLLMGENYVGNGDVGRRCHGMRKSFEQALWDADAGDLKRGLYEAFAELGLGRLVAAVGRKS